jgi:hypothetical protein
MITALALITIAFLLVGILFGVSLLRAASKHPLSLDGFEDY